MQLGFTSEIGHWQSAYGPVVLELLAQTNTFCDSFHVLKIGTLNQKNV